MLNRFYLGISFYLIFELIAATDVTIKNETIVNRTEQFHSKPKTVLSPDLTHSGREHVTEKSVKVKQNLTEANVSNDIKSSSVTVNNTIITTPTTTKNTIIYTKNSSTTDNTSLPITLKSSTTRTEIVSTEKLIPKKPLITTHDYDQVDSIAKKVIAPPPNIMNIDPFLTERNNKRSNYVVPIVAIILSVPLVAAVISVLYKRGKDWWVHRNYRRMDYLIEGLYNS